ncbi:unnamed protein product, partial [Gulo gulo]
GGLQHLFYVTYQLKNTARHLSNNWAKAGEVNASDPDLAHTSECSFQAYLYYPNEATCKPSVLYKRLRDGGIEAGVRLLGLDCSVCLVINWL